MKALLGSDFSVSPLCKAHKGETKRGSYPSSVLRKKCGILWCDPIVRLEDEATLVKRIRNRAGALEVQRTLRGLVCSKHQSSPVSTSQFHQQLGRESAGLYR